MIKAAVIGNPIKHSRSPLIHNHWLNKCKIKGVYEPIYAENEKEFINLVKHLVSEGYSGFNVTIPFKKIANEMVDIKINNNQSFVHDELMAINTIKIIDDKLIGYNTDFFGFFSDLNEKIGSFKHINNIIILGAGGTSRSIAFGLSRNLEGNKQLIILNRSKKNATELGKAIAKSNSSLKISTGGLDEIEKHISNCDLIINTTSIGMEGVNSKTNINLTNTKTDLFVYDVIYTPLQTNLLKEAKRHNLRFSNGLGMLINQAAPGFCYFFDYDNHETLIGDRDLINDLEKNIGI